MAKRFDVSVIFKAVDRATPTLKKIGRSIKNTGREFASGMKQKAQIGALALTAFATIGAKTAAEFEGSMNFVGAVTNATADEMKALRKTAIEMGESTQFSATEAAKGLEEFGLAGFGAAKSMKALPKTLELATAAQIGIGDATSTVTGVMAGYKFEAKDLGRVNDVLVNAFTKSKTALIPLGESFQKLGPLAKNLGFEFEEITGGFALLGNNAIEGSIAGTGMKRMFMELLSPSKKQRKIMKLLNLEFRKSDGSLKSLTGIIQEFEKAGERGATKTQLMTAAVEIFGSFGAQVFIPLLAEGSKRLIKMTKEMKEQGVSARIAASQMKGLKGAFELLKSKIDTLKIAIFGSDSAFGRFFDKQIRNAGQMVGAFTKWIKNLDSSVYDNFIATWNRFTAVVFGFGEGIALTIESLGEVAKNLGFFNDEMPTADEAENLRQVGQALAIAFSVASVAALVAFMGPWTAFVASLVWIVQNWQTLSKFFEAQEDPGRKRRGLLAPEPIEFIEGDITRRKESFLEKPIMPALLSLFGSGADKTSQPGAGFDLFKFFNTPIFKQEISQEKGFRAPLKLEITVKQAPGLSTNISDVQKTNDVDVVVNSLVGPTLTALGIQ